MADFSSLQQKVNALKAKVEQSSITPPYLGSILDNFITQMKSIDMTGMSDDVQNAVANATSALQEAQQALTTSQGASESAADALSKSTEALNAVAKLTPIRIESEEALDAMRTLGLLKDGQMYYIPEED